MTILDFSIRIKTDDRAEALDQRDSIVDLLQENGYKLLATFDGVRALLSDDDRPTLEQIVDILKEEANSPALMKVDP